MELLLINNNKTMNEDEIFEAMAMEAMIDLGLPEDEAELMLEDFNQ